MSILLGIILAMTMSASPDTSTTSGICVGSVEQCRPVAPPTQVKIFFPVRSDKLSQSAKESLADFVTSNSAEMSASSVVVVKGYADTIGTAENNLDLSTRRAQTVSEFLIAQGIDRNKIRILGMGEVAGGRPGEGYPENRRVEITVEK